MKLKTVFDADVMMKNQNNRVSGEQVINIVANEPYFVEHSIYFATTLRVFRDEAKTESLIENTDYVFSEIDSIASEMSNKDCYRAITFLDEDLNEAWIDYHSYGDVISAELFNHINNAINEGSQGVNDLNLEVDSIKTNLQNHIDNKAPHGANVSALANSLVLRSDKGTIEVEEPQKNSEAVNLGSQINALQNLESSLVEKINQTKNLALAQIEEVDKKVIAEEPALTLDNFIPSNYNNLTLNEQIQAQQQAQEELDARLEQTLAKHNAIRNKNGNITVPDAVDEGDAINKKIYDADLNNLNTNISNLENNLSEALNALESATGRKDIFEFKNTTVEPETILFGEAIKTNKEWAGKPVWRVGALFTFSFNVSQNKIQRYILIENLKNEQKLTDDDIEILFVDGIVEAKAPANAGPNDDDSFYLLRDVVNTTIQKTVASASYPKTWWINLIPQNLKTYNFKIWIEFTKVE